jgi:NADH dehydrogenase
MKVFLTGASGFVGREITSQLLTAGHHIVALSHNTKPIADPNIQTVTGDVTHLESLHHLKDCDAVIHLVGIIKENRKKGITFRKLHTQATQNLIIAAQRSGVKRFLYMSANGVCNEQETPYFRTKLDAENLLQNSGLNWTIFRPSLIFGPNDQFTRLLLRLLGVLPFMPVLGSGNYQLQPVHVSDVAATFVEALQKEECFSQIYCCGGPERLSYNELLDRLVAIQGNKLRVRKLRLPLSLARPFISLIEHLPFTPITNDQLEMLTAGNCCSNDQWTKTFSITPRALESLQQ